MRKHKYTLCPKTWTTQLMVITMSKPNRVSKFFYHWKEEKIVSKTHIIYPTTPKICLPHYLWKIHICDKVCGRLTFSRPAMVSVGISQLGLTDLIFVDPGVAVNGCYCCDVLLLQQLLPVNDARRVRRFLHLSTRHAAHLHTGHATAATLCDFLSSQ